MFSSKLRSFVECCSFDSSGLVQTQNNFNIEIGEAANNYKRFFNLTHLCPEKKILNILTFLYTPRK